MMKRTLIYLFIISILYSCGLEKKEVVTEKWEDGSTKVSFTYENPDDTTKYVRTSFHTNGKIESKGFVVDGEKDGLWKWWYDNGKKQDLAHLNNGIYEGTRKHWRKDGTLRLVEIIEGNCHGECCDGKLIFYDDSGVKLLKYQMKNGDYNGFGYGYHKDGSIERKFYYENGKKKGMSYEYHTNGKISASGNYINDLEQGKWIYKDSLGTIFAYEYFENGKSINVEKVNR